MPSSACDWSSDVCSSDRSEEHTSELQSRSDLVCRLLLEKKKQTSELQSRSDLVCRLLPEKKKQTQHRDPVAACSETESPHRAPEHRSEGQTVRLRCDP